MLGFALFFERSERGFNYIFFTLGPEFFLQAVILHFGCQESLSAKIILEVLFNFKINFFTFFLKIQNQVFEVGLQKPGCSLGQVI